MVIICDDVHNLAFINDFSDHNYSRRTHFILASIYYVVILRIKLLIL